MRVDATCLQKMEKDYWDGYGDSSFGREMRLVRDFEFRDRYVLYPCWTGMIFTSRTGRAAAEP